MSRQKAPEILHAALAFDHEAARSPHNPDSVIQLQKASDSPPLILTRGRNNRAVTAAITKPPAAPSNVLAGLIILANWRLPISWPVTWLKPSNAAITI